jgi:DNA-directed RNA polymerase subunit RPC12/RpoP
MERTGKQPGKGTYICELCGKKIILDNDNDTLPTCPNCSHTFFRKSS